MTAPTVFFLCMRLQLRYAEHIINRRKSRHNSKRVTLRVHRRNA